MIALYDFSVLDTKIALGECILVRLSVSDAVEMGKIGYAFDVASYVGSFFYVLMSLLRNGVGLSFFFLGVCFVELRQLGSSEVDMGLVSDLIQTSFFLVFSVVMRYLVNGIR